MKTINRKFKGELPAPQPVSVSSVNATAQMTCSSAPTPTKATPKQAAKARATPRATPKTSAAKTAAPKATTCKPSAERAVKTPSRKRNLVSDIQSPPTAADVRSRGALAEQLGSKSVPPQVHPGLGVPTLRSELRPAPKTEPTQAKAESQGGDGEEPQGSSSAGAKPCNCKNSKCLKL